MALLSSGCRFNRLFSSVTSVKRLLQELMLKAKKLDAIVICGYYNANMEISFFPAKWKPCHTSTKKHHQLAKFRVEVNNNKKNQIVTG